MFAPSRYIAWVLQFYGKATYDLATSGIPVAPWSELGTPMPAIDDPAGWVRFREALAVYNDVPVAEVVPALGTSHAFFLAYAAMLSPGDELLVEHPGYEPLTRAAEGLGVTVRYFDRLASENFRVDPERVAAAMTDRTRAVVVTNLHNPTGVRIPDATIIELAQLMAKRGGYLLVDEVYAPFDALPEDGIFRTSARKLAPNIVAVSSLTKCYGLGPHRVGWVLGPAEIVAGAEAAIIASNGHLPLSHAHLGIAALQSVGTLAKRAKRILAGKREIAERWAASVAGARWSAPQDGLFGLLTIDGAGDLLPLIEANAREGGVLVGAGTFFGVPNGLRLSWATLPPDKFEEGLARLGEILRG